jgi:hypothetical protein
MKMKEPAGMSWHVFSSNRSRIPAHQVPDITVMYSSVQPFQVLKALLERPGQLVSRERLQRRSNFLPTAREAFAGAKRVRLTQEGVFRENIRLGLEQLARAELEQ